MDKCPLTLYPVDNTPLNRHTWGMTDDPERKPPEKVTRLQRKLLHANMEISDMGNHNRPEYLHALLCQVGLPRSRQEGRDFVRSSGGASVMISAGSFFNGKGFTECPLPYGSMPRLALIHLCSEAIRQGSPVVDVGDGIKPFLRSLGLDVGGNQWKSFKAQMTYLSCARMTFGWLADGRIKQSQFLPIHEFSAWDDPASNQRGFWPDEIKLSSEFFETLKEHAVPLDPRAVHALQKSALALDVYAWLAARLCRVRKREGVKLSWANLKEQFGHEYATSKDFKKEFRPALRKALIVYPDAHVSEEIGGLRLHSSHPPIKQVTVATLR